MKQLTIAPQAQSYRFLERYSRDAERYRDFCSYYRAVFLRVVGLTALGTATGIWAGSVLFFFIQPFLLGIVWTYLPTVFAVATLGGAAAAGISAVWIWANDKYHDSPKDVLKAAAVNTAETFAAPVVWAYRAWKHKFCPTISFVNPGEENSGV